MANNYGLWDVKNIKARYISDSWVQLSCEFIAINGERDVKNIYYTPIDRLLGVDFETKVTEEARKFVSKMRRRNSAIMGLNEKAARLRRSIGIEGKGADLLIIDELHDYSTKEEALRSLTEMDEKVIHDTLKKRR